MWNDHIVIPVRATGGAAGGKFGVPEKIFEVQLLRLCTVHVLANKWKSV